MLLSVIVIIDIVVGLVSVVLHVQVGVPVEVSKHSGVCISVSLLNVVVEWNGREWLEIVWVHCFVSWHTFELLLFSSGLRRLLV